MIAQGRSRDDSWERFGAGLRCCVDDEYMHLKKKSGRLNSCFRILGLTSQAGEEEAVYGAGAGVQHDNSAQYGTLAKSLTIVYPPVYRIQQV